MRARISWGIAGALIALGVSLVGFAGTPSASAGATGTDGDLVLGSSILFSTATCNGAPNNCTAFSTAFTNVGPGPALTVLANKATGLEAYGATSGVHGKGTDRGVSGKGGTGVYGEGTENGVQAKGGTFGVFAEGDDYGTYSRGPNYGVFGNATGASGTGVWGDSSSGTGVRANSATGTALQVTGKAKFSRSGVATVAGTSTAQKNSVRVTLPITAKSMMTATLQKYVPGVFVVAAVPNVAGGYFTIYLNRSVSTSVGPISWMVVERP
jgi:hypothetical protein